MIKHSTKPPFSWFGGKSEMLDFILPEFPEHRTFVDVFGGAGSVILWKKPSMVDVYNDIDSDLVRFFRMCRQEPEELAIALALTPYAREEWEQCQNLEGSDNVELARRFATVARQSHGGHWARSWSKVIGHCRRGMSSSCSRWLNLPEAVLAIAAKLQTVQIDNMDFRDLIRAYDASGTLFYCDPPYLPSTRKNSSEVYREEMNETDHVELLDLLVQTTGSVVLSGYESELYSTRLSGWRSVQRKVKCRSNVKSSGGIGDRPMRIETLWIKES